MQNVHLTDGVYIRDDVVCEDVDNGPSGYTQVGRVGVCEKRINFLAELLAKL